MYGDVVINYIALINKIKPTISGKEYKLLRKENLGSIKKEKIDFSH